MKKTLSYGFMLLTFMLLAFVSNTFAQGNLSSPSVRLVYFLPIDRSPRPDREVALRQLIKDAQQFYADEMQRHGYGRKTFTIETDRSGEPVVHRVNGKFREEYYYNSSTDQTVWNEISKRYDNSLQHIYFIVIDLSSELLNYGDVCGLGGIIYRPDGGVSRYRWRDITSGEEGVGGFTLIPASGPCFEKLGLTLHELGHAFGIEHDFREGVHSDYIMAFGSQNRLSECAAEWLSVSRFFSTQSISNNSKGKIRLISTPTYAPEGIKLRFEVTDADGLHQAHLLVPENYESGSVGPNRLYECKLLNGTTSTLEFISGALTIDPVDRITLQIIDMDGSITWATFPADIASLLPPPKVVSIPDHNLAKVVRRELQLTSHAPITDWMMQRLTELYVGDSKVTNITGLEYATQLTVLNLGRNQIDRYDPLARLPKLRTLYLWGNGINDLSVLPAMPQLELLDLNWNQISDVSPLAEFTNLKELWLQGNKLTDTSTLFQLHNGTFPPAEEVKVIEERDQVNRVYKLLTFQSLDLKVRVNPDVKVFQSLNSLQESQQPVTRTDMKVDKTISATDVVVERAMHPPMYWINAKTGSLHRLVDNEVESLVPRVRNVTGFALYIADNKLYWTEKTGSRSGRIQCSNLNGTNIELVKTLRSVPLSIALDTVNRKIYLTNSWGKVQCLNFDGSRFQPNLITGLKAPKNLVVDVAGSKLYWTEKTGNRTGRIQRANLDGTDVQLVKTLKSVPLSIALGTVNRKIYMTNSWGKVQRLNLDGSKFQPNLITGLKAPRGIAVDAIRKKLYWTERGNIRRANLNGKNIQNIVRGLGTPTNLTLGILPVNVTTASAPATIVVAPAETDLHANYPNPFNPETWIPYHLVESADVTLRIYAANGILVRTLALGHQPAGIYQSRSRAAYWDGRNEFGEPVASGIYFYTLSADEFTATRKMLILK